MNSHNRVEVMHGVNLDQLGRRDPGHYGDLDFDRLQNRIAEFGEQLGLSVRFFQTNFEGEFVEHLHKLEGTVDAVLLNRARGPTTPGRSRDALELTGLPAVEVHLSAVQERETWRQVSVLEGLCLATISGQGADGYGEALRRIKEALADD